MLWAAVQGVSPQEGSRGRAAGGLDYRERYKKPNPDRAGDREEALRGSSGRGQEGSTGPAILKNVTGRAVSHSPRYEIKSPESLV